MNRLLRIEPRPFLLVNKIKHYAWGTRGENAIIPRLLGIQAEANKPYAEMWIGTHIKGPSDVVINNTLIPLDQLILQNALEILGKAVLEKFGRTLPYLLKVLSAAEALSIQVHPNKQQAQRLHAQDPEHYPDDNHKPELAIALDSLTALVGFRSFSGIVDALEKYPELARFAGRSIYRKLHDSRASSQAEQQELVQLLYSTLVRRSVIHIAELGDALTQLEERLSSSDGNWMEEERVFLNLRKRYPGPDVGLLSVFLMNLVHLKKGQGLFTQSGVPHAYLEGNIVECMANSDNVIRAGLTQKYTDIDTLLEALSYELGNVPIIEGEVGLQLTYQTPAVEFRVSRTTVEPGNYISMRGDGPRILLLTKGEILVTWSGGSKGGELNLRQGQSVLIPASLPEIEIIPTSSAELFKAEVPCQFR